MAHTIIDSDAHFIINTVTRQIRNDGTRKTTLIQNDHNSERFTFSIDRFIEGHDMGECNVVEVHYLNVSKDGKTKNTGMYTVKDLHVDGDKVTGSWLISQNATQLVGSLTFLLRFKCVEDDIITYAWHTAIHTGIMVSDGINADETFELEYVDIIEQWKAAVTREITDDVSANVSEWAELESGKVRGEMTAFSAQWNEALSVERKRIDNMVSGGTVDDAELMDIRVGADGVIYDSAGTAVRNTARMFVGLNGVEQVAPKNIYGVKCDCENLFNLATLYARGQYVYEVDKVLVWENSAGLDTYIFPVDGVSKYSFTNCRTAVVVGEDKLTVIRGFSSAALNSTTLDSTGGAYILFSFNYIRFPVGTYMISLGETLQRPTYQMPDWTGIPQLQQRIGSVEKRNNIGTAPHIKGDLTDGSHLVLNTFTNVRKNEVVSFYGDVVSFGTLEIGFSTSEDTIIRSSYVTIDSTNVTINFNYSGEATEAHGLDIDHNVAVILTNDGVDLNVAIISNGKRYQKAVPYVRFALSTPYCKMIGGSAVNCKLSWNAYDVQKPIWLFGDSYFSTTSASRWMTYLHKDGFTNNVLISSHAGATSVDAWQSLETLCAYGLPKTIVWCMGMNDGSDNDNAQHWFTYRDKLLTFCEENNITPVFATIPNVPNINHENKNTWIRSSGYSYVDFAKAVGADSSGTWFDGMLSTDGVHPTEKGAKSLYGRFMVDFPEITLK